MSRHVLAEIGNTERPRSASKLLLTTDEDISSRTFQKASRSLSAFSLMDDEQSRQLRLFEKKLFDYRKHIQNEAQAWAVRKETEKKLLIKRNEEMIRRWEELKRRDDELARERVELHARIKQSRQKQLNWEQRQLKLEAEFQLKEQSFFEECRKRKTQLDEWDQKIKSKENLVGISLAEYERKCSSKLRHRELTISRREVRNKKKE
eukprot:1358157-Amorphochlora_amoeboformis.AAC.2